MIPKSAERRLRSKGISQVIINELRTHWKPRVHWFGNQQITAESTPGRNEPCPCGSGKKYKQCCLRKE